MATLQNYLKSLNSAESQWGVWVNPENPEEYRVGQSIFENGGLLDGWICIGTLEDLSFGFQSTHDAFASWVSGGASEAMPDGVKTIYYEGKEIRVQPQAFYEAWVERRFVKEFTDFVTEQVDNICDEWSELAAEDFIDNKLPEILETAKAEAY